MRKSRLSGILLLILLIGQQGVLACSSPLDLDAYGAPPATFLASNNTFKARCIFTHLRTSKDQTCVISQAVGQGAFLLLYERHGINWQRYAEIPVPTFYEELRVVPKDLWGTGMEALLLKFIGDHGTGVIQNLFAIMLWRDSALRIALLETLSYDVSFLGNEEHLRIRYQFTRRASQNVGIALETDYRARNAGRYEHSMSAHWHEQLTWNEQSHSFYDFERENEIAKWGFSPIQRNTAAIRMAVAGTTLADLCREDSALVAIRGILNW